MEKAAAIGVLRMSLLMVHQSCWSAWVHRPEFVDTDLRSFVFMSDAKNSFVYVGQYFRLINIGK